MDDPREGVSKVLESSTLAVIARSSLRAAAPPTRATTASHVLLVDVAMPVDDRYVLVQLVLLALHRSNILYPGVAAFSRSCMRMPNLRPIPWRTGIGHLDPVAAATAPPLATVVPLRAAAIDLSVIPRN